MLFVSVISKEEKEKFKLRVISYRIPVFRSSHFSQDIKQNHCNINKQGNSGKGKGTLEKEKKNIDKLNTMNIKQKKVKKNNRTRK